MGPLVDANIGPQSNVGIVGIGGLGHVAIKLARALGAKVYAFTSKEAKRESLLALGASDVIVTTNENDFKKAAGLLDLIIDTVSAPHDLTPYANCLKIEATYAMVGVGSMSFSLPSFPWLFKNLNFHGSSPI